MPFLQILPVVVLSFVVAGSVHAQPPSNLFEWLKLLHDDEYKLHSAIDQNGYWFAIRSDSDGDIVFSCHRHDGHDADEKNEFTLRIEDKRGNDLRDSKSKKQNPKPIEIVASRQMVLGDYTTETEFTYTYLSGIIYPLSSNASGSIVVVYCQKDKDGKKTELFRQQISRPKLPDNKRMNRSRRHRAN